MTIIQLTMCGVKEMLNHNNYRHYRLLQTFYKLLTLMLQLGGGILPPRRTFYPVALKPLRIVTKAFVTFPEYMWAKKC